MSRPALHLASLLALLSLLACASAPPAPFDADQIRAASPAGRTYVQRTWAPDGASSVTTIRFVAVDEAGATLEFDAGGETRQHSMTWVELAGHGAQPAGAIRSEAACTVPAGTFECVIYEVDTAAGRTRSSFARALPGMPVRIERFIDGRWTPVMVIDAHRIESP